ncbi:MAG TPA: hypothetical protein VGM39_00885 [Kofleriaceae bacterium]|jgi:hypothetical protein
MTNSLRSFARYANGALVATLALVAAASRPEKAKACAYDFEDYIESTTTFDPTIADEVEGLYWDPYHAGFGGPCDECGINAALDDWMAYLGKGITREDWKTVLYTATEQQLFGVPAAHPAAKAKLTTALGVVRLARKLEPFSVVAEYGYGGTPPPPTTPPALIAEAKKGAKSGDAFIRQRYAFLGLRATFYTRDWKSVLAYSTTYAKELAGPSKDLSWRAKYYVAGANMRSGKRALANVQLADIHAESEALAAVAAQDFAPMEEKDWRAALALAKTKTEQVRLWRLVGLKLDGEAAMEEIIKLDPSSPTLPLLLVRELSKAESGTWAGGYDPPPAAQRSSYLAHLDQIANTLLTKRPNRPWLVELVAGHLAALRGDLTGARKHLGNAVAQNPTDAKVAMQAKASLAMAISAAWKMSPTFETEMATTMAAIDPAFTRSGTLTTAVRLQLANAYKADGKLADAELLTPGSVDGSAFQPGMGPTSTKPPAVMHWHDPAFIKQLIARVQITKTPWDKFVLDKSSSRGDLQAELAWRYILDGKIADGAKLYDDKETADNGVGTEPFAMHVVDCHDCDHDTYANAKWTNSTLAKKMVELEKQVKQGGDTGAKGALALGVAYYNLSWYGNARVVLESTHQAYDEPKQALVWFTQAFKLAKHPELKARAAYYAAKAQLGMMISASPGGAQYNSMQTLPVPSVWFTELSHFKDTAYYQEVLRECGNFAHWIRG